MGGHALGLEAHEPSQHWYWFPEQENKNGHCKGLVVQLLKTWQ